MFTRLEDKSEPGRSPCSIFVLQHGQNRSFGPTGPERRATAAFDRSIDLQVSRLRQKLATVPGGDELILTVRGEGYVLASAVEQL